MKPISVTFTVKVSGSQHVQVDVIDQHGEVRDQFILDMPTAGNLSRELQDACDEIMVQHTTKLPSRQIGVVSGRH